MATLTLTDPSGNSLNYDFVESENPEWVLGSAEDAAIELQGEGIAAHHATLTVMEGVPVITAAEGAVMLNGAAIETPTQLVPGAFFSMGGYAIGIDVPEKCARKTAHKAAPRRRDALPLPGHRENPIITLITPFYVIAVLAAAFVAGLSLRYWIVTGGFLPDHLF